jgi:hypothetical protein
VLAWQSIAVLLLYNAVAVPLAVSGMVTPPVAAPRHGGLLADSDRQRAPGRAQGASTGSAMLAGFLL